MRRNPGRNSSRHFGGLNFQRDANGLCEGIFAEYPMMRPEMTSVQDFDAWCVKN
jgi:hypothetical protein